MHFFVFVASRLRNVHTRVVQTAGQHATWRVCVGAALFGRGPRFLWPAWLPLRQRHVPQRACSACVCPQSGNKGRKIW